MTQTGDAPILVCTGGPRAGLVVPILEGKIDVGRDPQNDIVIEHPDISRFHAQFIYDAGSLWLRDVGSRNGVYVNETRLKDHQALKVGDTVRVADSTFQVRWELPEEPHPVAPPRKGLLGRLWPFK